MGIKTTINITEKCIFEMPKVSKVCMKPPLYRVNLQPIFEIFINKIFFGITYPKYYPEVNISYLRTDSDYRIPCDSSDWDSIFDLYYGICERDSDAKLKFSALVTKYSSISPNFSLKLSLWLEDVNNDVNLYNKYKVIKNYPNPMNKISNLRDLIRFQIIEYYNPVEIEVLKHMKIYSEGIFSKGAPMQYYAGGMSDRLKLKVMYMDFLLEPELTLYGVAKGGRRKYA